MCFPQVEHCIRVFETPRPLSLWRSLDDVTDLYNGVASKLRVHSEHNKAAKIVKCVKALRAVRLSFFFLTLVLICSVLRLMTDKPPCSRL